MDRREMMEFLAARRTYRRFAQRPVPQEVVEDILQAARLASSAANRQPLKFVVVQTPQAVAAVNGLVRWAGYLPKEVGTPKPQECPTLYVAVLQDTGISQDCDTDAGLALANMTAAAWAAGVGSCIMQAIDRARLCELLGLPENLNLHSMTAFGYPTHRSAVVELQNGDVKYYVDAARDYYVPKRSVEELVWKRL